MTTNWSAVRAAAAPVALSIAATTFLLTNGVPSADATRSLAGTVADWPDWAQQGLELASEGGLVLLALLLAITAWRARSEGPRRIATVVLGGVGVVLALVVSEVTKVLVAQDRPCRALPDLDAVVSCPPVGDWSLPSNHATLAAASAAALIWVVPRLWPAALALASVVALSRVGLGVHYPHDVVDGLVLGALVASAPVVLLRRVATGWITTAAGVPVLQALFGAARWPTESEAAAHPAARAGDAHSSPAPRSPSGSAPPAVS